MTDDVGAAPVPAPPVGKRALSFKPPFPNRLYITISFILVSSVELVMTKTSPTTRFAKNLAKSARLFRAVTPSGVSTRMDTAATQNADCLRERGLPKHAQARLHCSVHGRELLVVSARLLRRARFPPWRPGLRAPIATLRLAVVPLETCVLFRVHPSRRSSRSFTSMSSVGLLRRRSIALRLTPWASCFPGPEDHRLLGGTRNTVLGIGLTSLRTLGFEDQLHGVRIRLEHRIRGKGSSPIIGRSTVRD